MPSFKHSEVRVLRGLWLPTVVTHQIIGLSWATLSSPPPFPSSLLEFPGITSHINYMPSAPGQSVCFGRDTTPAAGASDQQADLAICTFLVTGEVGEARIGHFQLLGWGGWSASHQDS